MHACSNTIQHNVSCAANKACSVSVCSADVQTAFGYCDEHEDDDNNVNDDDNDEDEFIIP